jgi:hypothetical protein
MRAALTGSLVITAALATGPRPSAAETFACTEIIGVSVTGDWFGAGFGKGLDRTRFQARWRQHAFVDQWADPASDLWTMKPDSPCATHAEDPDHVVFTGVQWDWKTREAWETGLLAAVKTIREKHPAAKRIDLLTMLRGPGNRSCGSDMTVVPAYVDQAVAAVAARFPGLVFPGPRVEVASCDVFTKGGPHFTDEGMATVARLYEKALAR